MKKEIRTFTFPNGAIIDLYKIVAISPIEKSGDNVYFIPVHCSGINKPIPIALGYSNGIPEALNKERMQKIYVEFVTAWRAFERT